jgi:hypothetical protein
VGETGDAFLRAFASFCHSDSVISFIVGKGRVDEDRHRRLMCARLEFQRFLLCCPRNPLEVLERLRVLIIDRMASI